MANFEIALKKLLIHEGGYVNDPNDKGGETYKGISRVNHKKDNLWTYIDDYKRLYSNDMKKFKTAISKDYNINKRVNDIYKTSYWNPFKLDKVKNQELAEQIFDDAVNRGVAAACKLLCSLFNLPIVSKPTQVLLNKINEK